MRSSQVIFFHPFGCQLPHLFQVKEEVCVEDRFPINAIKAFNVAVLHWLSWLDILDFNLSVVAPLVEYGSGKFGAVIHPQGSRHPSESDNFLQKPDDPARGQRCIDFNGQGLPGAVVQDVDGSELPVTYHAIAHEVHTPTGIGMLLLLQRLLNPGWQLPFAFSSFVQF